MKELPETSESRKLRGDSADPVAVPFDRSFLLASRRWLKDQELLDLVLASEPSTEVQEAWFRSLPRRHDYWIRGIAVAGAPVGAFGLKGIQTGKAEYWGYIGEKEHRGHGIGKWMLDQVEQAARQLRIQALTLKVGITNFRAIRLYERNGFERVCLDGVILEMRRNITW